MNKYPLAALLSLICISSALAGILVVHEWWGHNDYARKRARMLAKQGFTALAVDMYGAGKQVDHPSDAGKFSGELAKNVDLAESRFKAAMKFLQDQPQADAGQISAIGYCFGGGMVLHMARKGLELDAVISFHGSLGALTEAEPGTVKSKILVCTGGEVPFVPQEQVDAFRKEMDSLKADYQVRDSAGDDPGDLLPLKYDKEADGKSWNALIELFCELYHDH